MKEKLKWTRMADSKIRQCFKQDTAHRALIYFLIGFLRPLIQLVHVNQHQTEKKKVCS